MDNLQYSPLTLAFLGDSVFELLVREALVKEANRPGSELHKEKLEFVSAAAQAEAFRVIESDLSEKELDVFKRGRNAHTNHTPKNMSSADYHAATGLEALFGYLHLEGETERINELFQKIWEARNFE
ncbi:MAG: ribonuclease III domain-containing protein [Clostridia bacterium]|nr:ribonuclease III domain-containing protein [Clostridia bacterium]